MEEHRLALTPGYQIEHFRIEAVLGKGGFGITYVAVDLQLGKKVAIKELLPDSIATRIDGSTVVPQSAALQENWEWARERFLDEARVLAGFSHPAIVGVHRLIEANGTVYMVMDFVDGESYEAKLRRIGAEPDQASLMAVIGPILDGLTEIHLKDLLHRDIKPENILINRRGQPVLIDFGSARLSVGATMTMTSIVTHGYSPIEQYQTKGRMGPWTDIYALGAVMCRAITGEKPHVAADRLMDDDFIWLSNRGPTGFDTTFLTAVDWALHVRPDERPKQIAEWEPHLISKSGLPPSVEHSAREETVLPGAATDTHEKAEREAWEKAERVAREKAYSIFLHAQSIGSTITEEQFSFVIESRGKFGISESDAVVIEQKAFGISLKDLLQSSGSEPINPWEIKYFLILQGYQSGPFSESNIKSMISRGKATRETLCWTSGMKDWKPIQTAITTEVAENTYVNYSQVPWYRKSSVNGMFIILSIISVGLIPGIIIVCIIVISGDVYFKPVKSDGVLSKWGLSNKVAVLVLLFINIAAIIGFLSFL